jgi:hypothetical protein
MADRLSESAEWEAMVRNVVDDIMESVELVVDVVVGHGASFMAHVLQRVDRLVDEVVEDAATVAREADELFGFACRCDGASRDQAEPDSFV